MFNEVIVMFAFVLVPFLTSALQSIGSSPIHP